MKKKFIIVIPLKKNRVLMLYMPFFFFLVAALTVRLEYNERVLFFFDSTFIQKIAFYLTIFI
jgi:hypothetical protein